MCFKCKNNSCSGGCQNQSAGDLANALTQLAVQQNTINALANSIQAFVSGHPILLLENQDDVSQFDLSTGIGSSVWSGWGICNGTSYLNPNTNKSVLTPNLLDKIPIAAGGSYSVDDIIGNDTTNLTITQLPAHNHAITDPGHTHTVTDPGHTHGITDPGHNHATTSSATGVTGTTDTQGAHVHGFTFTQALQTGGGGTTYGGATIGPPSGSSNPGGTTSLSGTDASYLQPAGSHSHTVTINNFNPTITMSDAETGVSTQSAFTGETISSAITGITTQNTGSGATLDLRQSSYAVFFVMKIY